MWRRLVLFLSCLVGVYGVPVTETIKPRACGYEACPLADPEKLNVHVIPHSHDDVGWLKTVDQYYFGNNIGTQRAAVQYIIDSVVDALGENPDRRFVQVESAFFWKWWLNHPEKHEIVKSLVNSGQLEFIGGAWSMNDEAATNYQSIIDQFTLGLRFLNDTFGSCAVPKVGWQIDPFGHSREMASIFTQLGYDSLYFARLDYLDKQERKRDKRMEMLWQGSANLGESSNLFTSALYNHYSAPPGFCFDVLCRDEYLVDDVTSSEYNAKEMSDKFVTYIREQSDSYMDTKNLIVTFGDDFHFQDASTYYKVLDRLIKNVNKFQEEEGGDINVFYSTPSCYAKAVHDQVIAQGLVLPTKTDDFMPYASDMTSFWSGYFTSRPTQKRYERQGNNLLRVVKQIYAMASATSSESVGNTLPLRQAMGVMQHHDAITGTEKQHVAQDYARIIMAAIDQAQDDLGNALKTLIGITPNAPVLPFRTCLLANVSHCETSTESQFIVLVYNSLSRPISDHIRLPVDGGSYRVIAPNSDEIEYQLTPSIYNFDYVDDITALPSDLVFWAKNVPPLGLKIFYVEKLSEWAEIPPDTSPERFVLGNATFGCVLDETTGLLSQVINGNVAVPVKQQFFWYEGALGTNGPLNRTSGAYIFRPSPNNPDAMPIADVASITVYKGVILDEVHQIINDWVRQIIRVYKADNYIEFDWLVGPIPIEDSVPKEIITRFTTNMDTQSTFYTDSNGREMLQRIRNFRPSFNFTTIEPVAGNYFPVTSRIVIRDVAQDLELAILNDRAQGGSSINDGEVELMVHRRLLADDSFGVGEALNEEEYGQGLVVRGQHYLLVGNINNPDKTLAAQERDLAQKKLNSLLTLVAHSDLQLPALKEAYNFKYEGTSANLPNNVQILTLEAVNKDEYILRLEHVLEENEDPNLSEPVTVDIQGLFPWLPILEIQETVLGANQLLSDSSRLDWTNGGVQTLKPFVYDPQSKAIEISLSPMQIRTFIIKAFDDDEVGSSANTLSLSLTTLIYGFSTLLFLKHLY